MRKFSVIFTTILLVNFALAVGCAQLGLMKAQSFDQRWAYAMALNTGIRSASVGALNSKAITANDGKQILAMNDAARSALDEAETLRKTDLSTAEAKLQLADSVIKSVETFLTARKVKVPVQVPKK